MRGEYWWGAHSDTVWRWRKALGVDRVTDGTSALLSRWAPETVQSAEANRRNLSQIADSTASAWQIKQAMANELSSLLLGEETLPEPEILQWKVNP